MRLLGVDLGRRRIGLAVAVTDPPVVTPRRTIRASGRLAEDAKSIRRIARGEEIDVVVVGVPLGYGASRQATICERFAEALRDLGERVAIVDESLTSREVDDALREQGFRAAARRAVADAGAACLILERYMEARDAR